MSKAAVAIAALGLALVLGAGALALGGLMTGARSGPSVALLLAGGGTIENGTKATIRQISTTGEITESVQKPTLLDDGTLGLDLPQDAAGTLIEVSLSKDDEVLWRVSPQSFPAASTTDGSAPPATLSLVAEPAALLPYLHGSFSCDMALAGQTVLFRSSPQSPDLVLLLQGERLVLQENGAGWTHSGTQTSFLPRANGSALVTLTDGSRSNCTPDLPIGLMPLLVEGDDWQLVMDATSTAFLRRDHGPLHLPASGILSEIEDGSLTRLHFRSSGPDAPKVVATYGTCTNDATGDRRSWRILITLKDGTKYEACAGDPAYDTDGEWKLVSLNAVYREFGGSLTLSARAFSAESFCHRHEGRVIRTEDSIRLVRESRTDLGECPSRARAMADALDAAMASGVEVRPAKGGRIGLVAEGEDLEKGIYILASRASGS